MKVLKSIKKRVKNYIKKKLRKRNRDLYRYEAKFLYGLLYNHVRVSKKHIMYESVLGNNFTGNPYALFQELVKEKKYKHIIVLNNIENDNILIKDILNKHKSKVKIVKRKSFKYVYYLLKCKYLINNTTFHYYFNKKPNQIFINTWHGTPIKTLGKDIVGNPFTGGNVLRNLLHTDFFIEPNSFTTDVFFKCLDIDTLYNNKVIKSGYPRNDYFYNNFTLEDSKKKFLKINNNKKTILYAPTYRGNSASKIDNKLNINIVKTLIGELNSIKDSYNLLFKGHQFISKELQDEVNDITFVPDWIDTNELLTSVDILITDYSSIMFDYLNTDNPIILYVPDEKEYCEDRGLYFPLSEIPGEICTTSYKVVDVINNIDIHNKKYANQYLQAKDKFCSYENGNAARNIIDIVFNNKKSELVYKPNQKSSKKKVLIYGGEFWLNGITASISTFLKQLDYDKYDLYLIKVGVNFEKEQRFKTVLNEVKYAKVLYNIESFNYSYIELVRQYKKAKKFETYTPKDMWEGLFSKEYRRLFGEVKFDIAIDYCGYGKRFPGLFAFSNSNLKIIYLHNNMIEEQSNKNNADYDLLFKLYLKKFDKLVSVSKSCNEDLIEKYPSLENKLMEIPNPIDYDGIIDKKKDNEYKLTYVDYRLSEINKLEKTDNTEEYLLEDNLIGINNTNMNNELDNKFCITNKTYTYTNKSDEILIDKINGINKFAKEENINFVSIGRFSYEKGYDMLIEAFAELSKEYANARLYLIGYDQKSFGNLSKTLYKELIEKYGLEDKFIIVGKLNNPIAFMSLCDCYVMSSRYEGQGIVLMEAIFAGLTAISTDIGGPDTILSPNHLYPCSIEGIYQGLKEYCEGRVSPNEFDFKKYQNEFQENVYNLFEK